MHTTALTRRPNEAMVPDGVAILGWGSLLWDVQEDFDRWHSDWQADGPVLPLEFSRISESRAGALTLVLDQQNGGASRVAWAYSKRTNVEEAVSDLMSREGTKETRNIGRIDLRNGEEYRGDERRTVTIAAWAREKGLSSVIWTGFPSNFEVKTGHPFSIATATIYLQSLNPEGRHKATEYIFSAPPFVQTKLRAALLREGWFRKAIQKK
jgi:hypothetical protein